jgi:hypothetical protein
MWSLRFGANGQARAKAEGLGRLLDPAFGFFVWAAHFLAVYVVTAVACVLGLGAASTGARSTFLATFALATVAAAAVTLLHALRRHRQQRALPELHFRMSVTIGSDAIASVAIIWQLFPILLVPACV